MPRRRNETPRVLGPTWIPSKKKWRIVLINPGATEANGQRRFRWFDDAEEAETYRNEVEPGLAKLNKRKTGVAIDEYKTHLVERGLRPKTYNETVRRLKLFFTDHQFPVSRITTERAKSMYDKFRAGKSVDYHLNALKECRTFMKWCASEGWIGENPFDKVKGIGKRKAGKAQLTGDEARKFHLHVMGAIEGGSESALAADMLLTMGLRQSEAWKRRVRDFDLDGTVLRVEDAKTKKGNRVVDVPQHLRPHLKRLTEGRAGFEFIFAYPDGTCHTNTWLRLAVPKMCAAAGVPRVTPHGLRGTYASLARLHGQSAQVVADALGHESTRTHEDHYARSEAVATAQQERVFAVIAGGRK
ncbi:MAG TPA: tyrosine-type recombinase/integrase [Rhizomicrobium sp.]|nr:tyrosine-type recombinase/integrase [Rhizomicrobium sp.]